MFLILITLNMVYNGHEMSLVLAIKFFPKSILLARQSQMAIKFDITF